MYRPSSAAGPHSASPSSDCDRQQTHLKDLVLPRVAAALVLLVALVFGNTASATPVELLGATASVKENTGGAFTRTLSYTVPAGNDRLLVVTSSGGGNPVSISSVTWNGVGMSGAASTGSNFGTGAMAGIWYVPLGSGPATTANVVVTYASNFLFIMTATAYRNVDQVAPIAGATAERSASLTVGSAPGSVVIDAIVGKGTSGTAGAGQTVLAVANDLIFSANTGGASSAPGAASVPMSWSVGDDGYLAHAAASITSTNPAVTSLSPSAGPTTAGTTVVITGRNFTGVTAVQFGATSTPFAFISSTQIVTTAPAGTGTVDVLVTAGGITSAPSPAARYTYVPAPTVTSVSPTAGPATGGSTVTITGTNFTNATAVAFGATAAADFTVDSPTQITATSPAAAAGTVDVRVTTVGGTSATSAADQYRFALEPTVTSLSPAAGPLVGATSVTVTGFNFTGATAVAFGATPASSFTFNSSTSITAIAPAGTGTVNVTVTTPGATSATAAANQFTYVPIPVVTSISPLSGPTIGGTSVTITGIHLSGATAVKFGATDATGFTVNSATQITATSPAGAGAADITVTTVGGTSATSAGDVFNFTTASYFTVTAPGTAAAGTAFNVAVTAFDSFNNLARGYSGTVHFTSTDSNAVLPADTTLTNGAGTFSTALQNAGSHTVTATDTLSGGIGGTTGIITVGESVTIAPTDASASVGGVDTGTYRFTRGGNGAAVTVNFALNGASTASTTEFSLTGAGVSFNGSTGSVIIPAGSTSADVTLTAAANPTSIAKPSKTVQLNVATASAYTVGSPSAGTVTLQQNGLVVFNTGDSGQGSLRQAIANANALAGDDTLTFDSALFGSPQTITLTTGSLNAGGNGRVIIAGGGADVLTISGNLADRVFMTTSSTADLTLYGLTVINGSASGNGGGVYVNGGTLTVIEAVIAGNTASASGGGVASSSGSTVRVINSSISGNTANGSAAAGGVDSAGSLTLTNTTISGNSVSTTNAANAGGLRQAGAADIRSTTITNNSTGGSTGAGGMLVVSGTASVGNTLIAANANNGTTADISGAFTSAGSNLIGNQGMATGLTNAVSGDLVGTGAAVLNPKLGALASNGGPTQTHLLLTGSPAINTGSSALLPADIFDLDADSDVAEALPLDQRGTGFPRVRGATVDIGAVEALIFTPALTAATTNEDAQSSSGLLITANSADAGGTTNYQITAITGGTLFKSDGSTLIASNDFITKAEGAAGLRFTPTADLFSPTTLFGFSVQGSITADVSGLKDAVVPAVITVNPVADTPSLTNASTTTNVQSVSGLVITRNAVDSAEVGFFKITNIQQGTLYQNDGTTVISSGAFITAAQGGAGLKFTSALNYTGVARFDVQGSVDNAGTGLSSGTATATIAIGTVNPTPVQGVPTDPITGLPLAPGAPYPVSGQTGTFPVRINITNTTAYPLNGFRVSVDYSAYLAAQPSLRLYNSSSAPGVVPAYIDYAFPVAVMETISLTLQFYTSTRQMPNPFSPTLAVTALAASAVTSTDGTGVEPRIIVRPNGTVLLEWASVPGTWYRVKYSSDLTNWFDSPVPLQAVATRTQWIDDGAPFTHVSPATVPVRFYRVNAIAAPTP